jgi:putative NADH-flavin reductase
MKRLLVFGATGRTGKEFVRQAIDTGLELTVVVRDEKKFNITHPNVKVVIGDVLDQSSFDNAMNDIEAVFSCVGEAGSVKSTKLYSKGITNILFSMQQNGVDRLICISSMSLYVNDEMGFFYKFLTKFIAQKIWSEGFDDMRLMEKMIIQTGLNWTISRAPALTNRPGKGKFRLAINNHIHKPFSISRTDLAKCVLNSIEDAKTFKATLEIAD